MDQAIFAAMGVLGRGVAQSDRKSIGRLRQGSRRHKDAEIHLIRTDLRIYGPEATPA